MKHIKIIDIKKTVKFMDQDLEIKQLTVKGVKDLQTTLDKNTDATMDAVKTLAVIFKATVVGAEDMADEEFEKFPIEPLTKLSNEILQFNGLGAGDDKGNQLGK
jgi:hypothetical protein